MVGLYGVVVALPPTVLVDVRGVVVALPPTVLVDVRVVVVGVVVLAPPRVLGYTLVTVLDLFE